jgi:hypothetical protein
LLNPLLQLPVVQRRTNQESAAAAPVAGWLAGSLKVLENKLERASHEVELVDWWSFLSPSSTRRAV